MANEEDITLQEKFDELSKSIDDFQNFIITFLTEAMNSAHQEGVEEGMKRNFKISQIKFIGEDGEEFVAETGEALGGED